MLKSAADRVSSGAVCEGLCKTLSAWKLRLLPQRGKSFPHGDLPRMNLLEFSYHLILYSLLTSLDDFFFFFPWELPTVLPMNCCPQ